MNITRIFAVIMMILGLTTAVSISMEGVHCSRTEREWSGCVFNNPGNYTFKTEHVHLEKVIINRLTNSKLIVNGSRLPNFKELIIEQYYLDGFDACKHLLVFDSVHSEITVVFKGERHICVQVVSTTTEATTSDAETFLTSPHTTATSTTQAIPFLTSTRTTPTQLPTGTATTHIALSLTTPRTTMMQPHTTLHATSYLTSPHTTKMKLHTTPHATSLTSASIGLRSATSPANPPARSHYMHWIIGLAVTVAISIIALVLVLLAVRFKWLTLKKMNVTGTGIEFSFMSSSSQTQETSFSTVESSERQGELLEINVDDEPISYRTRSRST